MTHSFIFKTDALVLSLILFVGMIVMVLCGRYACKLWNKEESEPKGGVSSLFGALFALSGLILAFTFGMSGSRLEKVRNVIESEANDIGTAVLRSDLYADSVRSGFRDDFKEYLEAVIAFYENAADIKKLYKAKEDAQRVADKLWARATQQSKLPNMLIPSNQMIPALNSMFDIAQSREIILKSRVPDLIVYMLFISVLATCFIGGFTSGSFHSKEWIIVVGFSIVTAMVVYTTIDLSRPLRGIIKDEAGKQAIIELRNMF
ncbi:MAG TPA: hypothetical protein VGQ53_19445 [Chitinophagaceae bacterium]|nr:hypothetical protein [Chitinophagaceae bacterium]